MNPRIDRAYQILRELLDERFKNFEPSVKLPREHLEKLATHLVIEALAKIDKPYSDNGLWMLYEDICIDEIDDIEDSDESNTQTLSFNTLRDL